MLSVYNGYFGAGSGVLLLALLLLTTESALAAANALKNMVVGAATITSAVLFAVFAHVDWTAVAPLAVGTFVGFPGRPAGGPSAAADRASLAGGAHRPGAGRSPVWSPDRPRRRAENPSPAVSAPKDRLRHGLDPADTEQFAPVDHAERSR